MRWSQQIRADSMSRFIKSLLRFVLAGTFAVGCAAQSQSSDGSPTQWGRDRLQIAEYLLAPN